MSKHDTTVGQMYVEDADNQNVNTDSIELYYKWFFFKIHYNNNDNWHI